LALLNPDLPAPALHDAFHKLIRQEGATREARTDPPTGSWCRVDGRAGRNRAGSGL
jgi:hypothetical protein